MKSQEQGYREIMAQLTTELMAFCVEHCAWDFKDDPQSLGYCYICPVEMAKDGYLLPDYEPSAAKLVGSV
jgi:hypothetical protein